MRLNSKRMMKYSDEQLESLAKKLAKDFNYYNEKCVEMEKMSKDAVNLKDFFSVHSHRRRCKEDGKAVFSELKRRGRKWWD